MHLYIAKQTPPWVHDVLGARSPLIISFPSPTWLNHSAFPRGARLWLIDGRFETMSRPEHQAWLEIETARCLPSGKLTVCY
jgi:hypothetical protein